ncbi:MAG: ParB/RepB/Spo0J family partition protein [Planctomycetes bacterium]|nr:ParB/RepB/Spo0J family partition protein [Planctomycetota bacterium]
MTNIKDVKKKKTKHLGRGLQSLLSPITPAGKEQITLTAGIGEDSNFPIDKELHKSLREIKIEAVLPNPHQPRTVWNQQDLDDLAESIKANGVIQPIIVRPAGAGFELIAGERRLRAANIAGLEKVPAIVRSASDEQMLELALIENIHRANLNPIERAKAYRSYLKTFSLTQEQGAKRLGESRSVVANYLRILDLPDQIKQMLTDGLLTTGHAKAILALPTDGMREKLAKRAMAGRLSVRELERLVRKYLDGKTETKPEIKSKPANIVDLENKLSFRLGTKVAIETQKNGQRGKIVIKFCSLDEFDRITESISADTLEKV